MLKITILDDAKKTTDIAFSGNLAMAIAESVAGIRAVWEAFKDDGKDTNSSDIFKKNVTRLFAEDKVFCKLEDFDNPTKAEKELKDIIQDFVEGLCNSLFHD